MMFADGKINIYALIFHALETNIDYNIKALTL